MIQTIAYLPTLLIIFVLIASLFATGLRSLQNRLFVCLAISVFVWQLLLYVSDTSHSLIVAERALRLALIISMFMPYFFYIFCKEFIGRFNKLEAVVAYIPIFFAQILSLSNLAFKTIQLQEFGVHLQDPSWGYSVIVFITMVYIIIGISILLLHKKGLDNQKKKQVNLIVGGVSISLIISFMANFVLINSRYSSYIILATGPSVIFFVGGIAYAIIKHRLFDIRLVVARSLGYLLSIGLMAFLYGIIAFTVISRLSIFNELTDVYKQTIYTLLAVTIALTFQPLKRFFDKWSNRVFYRDAYDSQELLDNLNKILLSTLDINKLLKGCSEVINKYIKTEFIMFGVKEIEGSPQRIIGTNNKQFSKEDIQNVRQITPMMRTKCIITDDLEEKDSKLRELLRNNDIGVLVRLTDTPNKIQEGLGYIVLGNKKSGSPFSSQDIKVLEIIADELVIALQNALRFEEIQNFNITLQDKVNDATKKLRSANHRLVELDQTKDDFISMASHQLRTPLTTIKGYLSMVIDGDVGKISGNQAELLSKAFISSQQMVYLIADLLNISRLRTGKFVIEPKETNLADVISGEIDQLVETAKAKGLELKFKNPKDFPVLMLDETKIRQVIMNFIDNAIYYTPAGGHIDIGLVNTDSTIEFTVTDDGIGVPKAEQHHLFTKFYRANNAKRARPDGTGLGLFMAKKVVIAQAGTIIFRSQEGKGSVFGFTFAKKPLLPQNYKGVAHKTSS